MKTKEEIEVELEIKIERLIKKFERRELLLKIINHRESVSYSKGFLHACVFAFIVNLFLGYLWKLK